jgi:bifunctional DNA-binding transcriptional regulator/antitoxin component of YhaV-PrlF toxin-antitoxin module
MEDRPARRRTATTISAQRRIAVSVEELRAAGLEPGERVIVRADGPGRLIVERVRDVVAQSAGILTGVYRKNELEELRNEWNP